MGVTCMRPSGTWMGKLEIHCSNSSSATSRPLLLVPSSMVSETVPFGHSVLRPVDLLQVWRAESSRLEHNAEAFPRLPVRWPELIFQAAQLLGNGLHRNLGVGGRILAIASSALSLKTSRPNLRFAAVMLTWLYPSV